MQAHDGIVSEQPRQKRGKLYRTAAQLLMPSLREHDHQADVTRQFGVPDERVQVVYLGVDPLCAAQT